LNNIKKITFIIFSGLILFSTILLASKKIGFITGSPAGTYAEFGHNIVSVCKPLEIELYESTGSVHNIMKLMKDDGEINFGIAQLDVLYVIKSISEEHEINIKNIKIVIPLYQEEIHLITKKESGIKNLEGLKNKIVNVGPKTSGTRMTTILISNLTGIKWSESNLTIIEAIKGLIKGEIAAVFYVIGKPFPIFQKFPKEIMNQIELVNIQNKALDTVYDQAKIPGKTYSWQPKMINTYSIPSILLTNIFVSHNKVASLTKCLAERLKDLKRTKHKKWGEVDLKNYKKIKWPIHPAVEKNIGK
jgi:TRAP transporter TAXI family solute receptor